MFALMEKARKDRKLISLQNRLKSKQNGQRLDKKKNNGQIGKTREQKEVGLKIFLIIFKFK